MATLPVPGAVLDYRVVGDGPLLVLIAGRAAPGPSTIRWRNSFRRMSAC